MASAEEPDFLATGVKVEKDKGYSDESRRTTQSKTKEISDKNNDENTTIPVKTEKNKSHSDEKDNASKQQKDIKQVAQKKDSDNSIAIKQEKPKGYSDEQKKRKEPSDKDTNLEKASKKVKQEKNKGYPDEKDNSGKASKSSAQSTTAVKQEQEKGYLNEGGASISNQESQESAEGELLVDDKSRVELVSGDQEDGESDGEIVDDGDPGISGWSHQECMAILRSTLHSVTKADELLKDLPENTTSEEVKLQIALEHGQAMTIRLKRGDGPILSIVVVQDGTVLDLKKAIERHYRQKHIREGGVQHLSWKFVWRSYHLMTKNKSRLMEDTKTLKDYGLNNKSQLTFAKKLNFKTKTHVAENNQKFSKR